MSNSNNMFYRVKKLYHDLLHRAIGDWQFFLYDEHKKEKMLLSQHYQARTPRPQTAPVAVFMANGYADHAGLCDRFKGMTTIYRWCKEHHYDFRICHTHPFLLDDYLVPNAYDWRIAATNVCYDHRWSSVNHCMLDHLVQRQMESGEILELEQGWIGRRMDTKKIQRHFYTNFFPKSNLSFGQDFQELFKPAPRLEQQLQLHTSNIGGPYISMSFRFMQLLGDFKDCDGEILPQKERADLIDRSVQAIEMVRQRHPDIQRILVTADSSTFLDAARRLPYVYVIEGRVGHIKFENSDEVNMKTFLDFFMIARAQKVYLGLAEKMYNSDFARRAAMVYQHDFELLSY